MAPTLQPKVSWRVDEAGVLPENWIAVTTGFDEFEKSSSNQNIVWLEVLLSSAFIYQHSSLSNWL